MKIEFQDAKIEALTHVSDLFFGIRLRFISKCKRDILKDPASMIELVKR